jgi:2-amino-4-deoxychorismate synthase
MTSTGLAALLGRAPAFAVLHRPQSGTGEVEVFVGRPRVLTGLADLPAPPDRSNVDGDWLLAALPFRQLAERGLCCHDDGTPLLALQIQTRHRLPLAEALCALPVADLQLSGGRFDLTDDEYGALVRRVVAEEIGTGAGANFVLRRRYRARLRRYSRRCALAIFGRLLTGELGAYWTFLVHIAGRTLVGASPECHARLAGEALTMNPISGTLRYPATGPSPADLLAFLADRKETEELYMVVDEELKMMARLCPAGCRVSGPRLRCMAALAHTEYLIQGRTDRDVRAVLRGTMFAPTVTGSPLANACRVIARHESAGRGFYGGVLALIGQREGRASLDSAILIRTADISASGRLEIGVGATVVRHSVPEQEAAETAAKAAGLLTALTRPESGVSPSGPHPAVRRRPRRAGGRSGSTGPVRPAEVGPLPQIRSALAELGSSPRIRSALAARNTGLSRFWLHHTRPQDRHGGGSLSGRRLLVIDAEDDFTEMLAHLVRALGASIRVQGYAQPCRTDSYDAVVIGPGPGDPRDHTDAKIARLRAVAGSLLTARVPVLGVCLGHQVLASLLGLPLRRRARPAQGVPRHILLSGRLEWVGCYNTFAAFSAADELICPYTGGPIAVSRDPVSAEVFALRGSVAASIQFHPESILTEHGPDILADLLGGLCVGSDRRTGAGGCP